jgi:uncharacterized protein (DUF1330 family)
VIAAYCNNVEERAVRPVTSSPVVAAEKEMRKSFVLIAEVDVAAIAAFDHYESAVLPLLAKHGGVLERRLRHVRDDGGWLEVHVVSFPSREALDAYRGDPERSRAQELIAGAHFKTTLVDVNDV